MKNFRSTFNSFPRQMAVLTLASVFAIPIWAQDQVNTGTSSGVSSQSAPASTAQAQPSTAPQGPLTQPKEGFWGRMNPFARKKWVKRQTDPINDRLTELDEVNAQNAKYIKDVDARAQAGIQKAQSAADQANQTAMAANSQAQNASNTAQQASQHVDNLKSTVNGLDQYHRITEAELTFRGGSPVLTADSKTKLDQLASSLAGREGYIIEMEAHSPMAGSAGIQSSERLNESVKRYLVTEHQIPIYRMHAVALGNEQVEEASNAGSDEQRPERVRTSSVHLVLMENSLAARAEASPQSAPAAAGAEQP